MAHRHQVDESLGYTVEEDREDSTAVLRAYCKGRKCDYVLSRSIRFLDAPRWTDVMSEDDEAMSAMEFELSAERRGVVVAEGNDR